MNMMDELLRGLWNPTRKPFIGDPSGSGNNVASDYIAGGKYSSQLAPPMATVAAPTPTPPPLTGAWTRPVTGSTSPSSVRLPPGMPVNLAAVATQNLTRQDAAINRFNVTARLQADRAPILPASSPVSATRSPVSSGSLRSFVQNYRPVGMDKPYNQIVSETRWGSGL